MARNPQGKAEAPVLQFSILCDSIARPPEAPGKPVFVGVFSNLVQPSIIPQFFVANRWINGRGKHTQTVLILDPDLEEIFRSDERLFSLVSRANSHDIYIAFVNMRFPKAGVYWVKILLDGDLVLSYPLPVFEGKEDSAVGT